LTLFLKFCQEFKNILSGFFCGFQGHFFFLDFKFTSYLKLFGLMWWDLNILFNYFIPFIQNQ